MAARSSRSSDSSIIKSGFFEPGSLAVIGASAHPEKVGYAILANIIKSGYEGEILPVNPHADAVQDIPCFPDVASLPRTPDLALIVVPARAVPDAVAALVAKGTRASVVISAGFREVGIAGRQLEHEVLNLARGGGMRLLGPNCLGIMNTGLPLNASFARKMPPRGSIGVISQSGAICTSLIDWARAEGVGFSKMISLGNSADLVESDFLDALGDDESTTVISMYVEGVSDGSRFFDSLREASKKKPVILFKAGTTQEGAQAASSHTGALAGSESAYDAACKQAPALRARTVEELIQLSRSLATQPVPQGRRVAIVTNAGGPGIIASDACEKAGMTLAEISETALKQLSKYMPSAGSTHNPVDLLGDADAMLYAMTLETMLADPQVDAVLVILTPQAMTEIYRTADEIIRLSRNSNKTIMCSFMGAGSVDAPVSRLQKAGIPNIPYPDQAMMVLGRMYERTAQAKRPASRAARLVVDRARIKEMFASYEEKGQTQVDQEDCRVVLEAYGIPFAPLKVAGDFDEAEETARAMGYPVVLKIVSPQIVHKTDVGGVVLDIKDAEQLEDAYYETVNRARRQVPGAEIYGVSIQKMMPQGRELILGMAKDPQFGALIMAGLGGIYVEAFNDVAFRLAPLSAWDAGHMLRELKAYSLLSGMRGERAADVDAVEDVLLRISRLALDHPALSEMDINPLMVYNSGDGCACVDIRMTLGG
jgi:acetyl coenzyme A synthetase (ADP forming)-like protein